MPETLEERIARRKREQAGSGGGTSLERRVAARKRELTEEPERRSISQIARDTVLGPEARRARSERVSELKNYGAGAGLGVARGLAATGRGIGWVGRKTGIARGDLSLSDVVEGRTERRNALERSADKWEREAEADLKREGTAAMLGEVTGRIGIEGAMLLTGGGAIGKGIAKVAQGTGRAARITKPTARAIAVGRAGNLAQRTLAQTVPYVPIDATLGAGAVDPEAAEARRAERAAARGGRSPSITDRLADVMDPTTRAGGAALNVGLGAGGAAAIESIPSIYRTARAAIAKVPTSRRAAAEALDPSIADELRGAHRAAETDELTGVANARALKRALPKAEQDPEIAVTVFDANRFGEVNKLIGHEEGDRVLADIGAALKQAADEHGVGERVFRKGGDEFVILSPKAKADAVRQRATEIFGDRLVTNPNSGETVVVSISGSTGDTFKDADSRLQAIKEWRKDAQARGQLREPVPPTPADDADDLEAFFGPAARVDAPALDADELARFGWLDEGEGVPEDLYHRGTAAQAGREAPDGDDVARFFGDDPPPVDEADDVARFFGTGTRSGAADPTVISALTGSGLGAASGAAIDEENRGRGAMLGAAAGAGAGYGAARAIARTAGASRALAMPDDISAAYRFAAGEIDFTGKAGKAARRRRVNIGTKLQRIADRMANGLGAIERLGNRSALAPGKNPADLLSYVKSSDATVVRAFNWGVMDPVTREKIGPSFREIFEPLGEDDELVRQALTYAVAKRIVGRGPSAVADDADMFREYEKLAQWGDRQPELRDFARRWEQFTDAIGNYAVRSGMWTADLWQRVKASDALYVRFRRIMDARVMPEAVARVSKSMANVGPGVDEFIGSKRRIEDPATAIAEYGKQIIHRADRYRVGAAVMEAIDDMGLAGTLVGTRLPKVSPEERARAAAAAARTVLPDGEVAEEVISLFDVRIDRNNPVIWRNAPDGSKEHMLLHAADLWKALSQMNVQEEGAIRTLLDVTIRPLKRIFTATATMWNPRFMFATNPIRDTVDAIAKTQASITPAKIAQGYYESIKAMAGKSELADEAQRFGLGNVSIFAQDRPRATARRYAPVFARDRVASRAGRALSAPVRGMEAIGTVSDRGPRLAEYEAALARGMKKVESGEWTIDDARLRAGTLGRGVTLDFSNKPGGPVLRFFADYIPFFGVALQAPVQMTRAAVRNPKRVASVAAGAATAAVTAWALTEAADDETRDEIRDRYANERAGFLLVPLPGGALMRVPLQQEVALIVQGVTAGLDGLVADDPAAGKLLWEAVMRALPPGISEVSAGVVPVPGLQQIGESARNRRVFGDRPIVSRRLEGASPAERRHHTTAPTFDALAQAARSAGLDEVSPLDAENFVRGITNQATPMLTALTDPVAERAMGRKAEKRVPRPLVRHSLNPVSAVLAPPSSGTESEERFYELRRKVEQAYTDRRTARLAKDREGYERLGREHRELLQPGLRSAVAAVYDRVQDYRARERAVQKQFEQGRISGEVARRRLDKLSKERLRGVRRSMRRIEARMRGDE
jgi:diguanylate cyclase (GGDEF)-like protein